MQRILYESFTDPKATQTNLDLMHVVNYRPLHRLVRIVRGIVRASIISDYKQAEY